MGRSSENEVFGGPNSVRPMVFVGLSGLVELDPPTFSSSAVRPSGMDGSLLKIPSSGGGEPLAAPGVGSS